MSGTKRRGMKRSAPKQTIAFCTRCRLHANGDTLALTEHIPLSKATTVEQSGGSFEHDDAWQRTLTGKDLDSFKRQHPNGLMCTACGRIIKNPAKYDSNGRIAGICENAITALTDLAATDLSRLHPVTRKLLKVDKVIAAARKLIRRTK